MLDSYTMKARLAPAALAALPAIGLAAAAAVLPSASATPVAAVLGAVGILICGAVRDRGRGIQAELWASWGGPPTRQRLRWRGSTSPEATAMAHQRLETALGVQLPTEADEMADAGSADRRYDDAIATLRERTREGYPLVQAENSEYGFRRNAFGLRPVALGVAIATGVASVVLLALTGELRFLAAGVFAIVVGAAWRSLNEAWVRRAAELYADRLLDAARTVVR